MAETCAIVLLVCRIGDVSFGQTVVVRSLVMTDNSGSNNPHKECRLRKKKFRQSQADDAQT